MPEGLHGSYPEEAFTAFRDHLNDLLHHTVTQAPLVQIITGDRAFLEFRQGGAATAVPVGAGYYLFLGQTLRVDKIAPKTYRLRTLAYAYRIAEGPLRTDQWLIRWEYNSREHQPGLHPRHHCHVRAEIAFGRTTLSLEQPHIHRLGNH